MVIVCNTELLGSVVQLDIATSAIVVSFGESIALEQNGKTQRYVADILLAWRVRNQDTQQTCSSSVPRKSISIEAPVTLFQKLALPK